MQTISQVIEKAFKTAFLELNLDADILLTEATRPEFGDFQVNGVMKAAKILKCNPRELATQVIAKVEVELDKTAARLEVAGGGFINITLNNNFLANYINELNENNKFGVKYLKHEAELVVVDMSSPNLAKEMHVGHLRSTVIGDALARMCEYMGDVVIRQNHVGDWGTQFGMLIAYMEESFVTTDAPATSEVFKHKLADLENFYREAKAKFDADSDFADKARQFVVILQNHEMIERGDYSVNGFASLSDKIKEQCKKAHLATTVFQYWKSFREISLAHCQTIYDELNIPLNQLDSCARGESWYNDKLSGIVDKLDKCGVLSESDGAKCVFFTADELPGGIDTPLIIQKKDGGFLYATTDLAAMDYRADGIEFSAEEDVGVSKRGANRIIYVVDARQSLHFRQLFVVARKAGIVGREIKLEHAYFGTMMNEGGQPFKTRDGGVVRLGDLISEAKLRARKIVDDRNIDWSDEDKNKLANTLAIDAIKYSDLSKNRASDYIFSFDKMLAFDGNTAPYLLYAYTRIQSVIKKALDSKLSMESKIVIVEAAEHKLALHLAKFADMLLIATLECYPHYVSQYLYDLAGCFMQFYESCSILKAENIECGQSRLALANLTAEVLKIGLEQLLGIQVVDRM